MGDMSERVAQRMMRVAARGPLYEWSAEHLGDLDKAQRELRERRMEYEEARELLAEAENDDAVEEVDDILGKIDEFASTLEELSLNETTLIARENKFVGEHGLPEDMV